MTTSHIGKIVREQRKKSGMNQADLGMVSGTGRRFISDLENGKETCQIGKAMMVLESLGIELEAKTRTGEELDDGENS